MRTQVKRYVQMLECEILYDKIRMEAMVEKSSNEIEKRDSK